MAKLKTTSVTGALTVSGEISGLISGADINRGTISNARINSSSTTQAGVVQLNNSTNSTSTTQAATANAVKLAYDKSVEALNASNGKLGATENAVSATKLQTARTISLGGDIEGSASFDGTSNVTITANVLDDSHEHTQVIGKNKNSILRDFGNGNVVLAASKSTAADASIGDLYLGYNTSTYFTRNIRLESPVNWKGAATYIIDASGKVDWNVLKNIPSPTSFGAVATAGGTMTGTLRFNVGTNVDAIRFSGSTRDSFIKKITNQGGLLMSCDSSTMIFGGDNYELLKTGLGLNEAATTEQVIIGADNTVRIITNMQTDYASSKEFTFGTNGRLTVPADVYVGSSRVYHQGFKPTSADVGALASGGKAVDSSKLNGASETTAATANTIAKRDSSGDIHCRLIRTDYANQSTISGAIAYRINNSTDNFTRYCSDPGAVRNWLGAMSSNPSTIDMSKNGTVSRINFAAQTNDPGYIEHYESNNTARLRLSVSDDIATGQDALEVGSGSGSAWAPKFRVWTSGAVEIVDPTRTWYEGGNIWSTSGPSGSAHKGALWIQY